MGEVYQYLYRCLLCKNNFTTNHPRSDDGSNVCDKCKERIESKKAKPMDERIKGNNKEGFNGVKKTPKTKKKKKTKEKRDNSLMNSNPDGYNKYKKNPDPKPKNPYETMTKDERNDLAIKLFQASKKFHRLYRSALARSTFLINLNDNPKEEKEIEDMSNEKLLEIAKELEK